MAASNGDKTESASPQKLRKAREEGRVPRSREWATAVGIFVCLEFILAMTPDYLAEFRLLFTRGFGSLHETGEMADVFSQIIPAAMLLLSKMILPLLTVPLIVGVCSLFPGGWTLTMKGFMPQFERLSPAGFVKRTFAMKHMVDTGTSILKSLLLIVVMYYVTHSGVAGYLRLQALPLDAALVGGAQLLRGGELALCSVFILFALIDLPVQALVFSRSQRMSKAEVKEEHQTSEGRPEVRQRIRQLRQQIARRTVRQTVPKADVVVVNPEHYAIALKYDEARASAPFVVAKGVDEMALYIRRIAAEHGIEVVSLPPLARAIYSTSQINQQIPAALYTAVAQVLSYVLQIRAFRAGFRPFEPDPPDDHAVPEHLKAMTP